MSVQQEKFKEIADAIREKTGETGIIKPSDFASKISDVYQAGQNSGGSGGYDEGFEAGKQEMLDAVWEDLQDKGKREDYRFAFAHIRGNEFYPKYDIKPTGVTAQNLFYKFNMNNTTPINLYERIDGRGLKLDLSKATNVQLMFGYAKVSRIGTLDLTNINNLDRCFMNVYNLTTIDKLIVAENNQFMNQYGNAFASLSQLNEIRFEGVIANDINFQWSPLSRGSIENIVSVLSDTTTDKTVIFKESAVNNAFTADEWNALMNTKPNWSFAFGQEG